jgi:hypothetical protein
MHYKTKPVVLRSRHATVPSLEVTTLLPESTGGSVVFSDSSVLRVKIDSQTRRLEVMSIRRRGQDVFKITVDRKVTVYISDITQQAAAEYWLTAVQYCNEKIHDLPVQIATHDAYMALWAGVCNDKDTLKTLQSGTALVSAPTS